MTVKRYPARFDIRDYGAIHRDTAGRTFPLALENMRADIVAYQATNLNCGVEVYVPAGHWYAGYPTIFDLDYCHFVGAGPSISVVEATGAFPALILGVDRAPAGISLTADHWVDLNGKMEFATVAGQYYGIRTKNDAHVAFTCSPWNSAGCSTDGTTGYWQGMRQFTIDFCIDWNGVAMPSTTCCLFGMGYFAQGKCNPWYVMAYSNIYRLDFKLSNNQTYAASFAVPGGIPLNGIHRVSIQFDGIAGKVTGYVGSTNANRVQMNSSGPGINFTPLPLAMNEWRPFMIGAVSSNASDGGGAGSLVDRSFYGLQLYRGLRYADNGAGTSQVRLLGGGISDSNAFLSNDNNVICWMANTENVSGAPTTGPNGPSGRRLVRWYAGPASTADTSTTFGGVYTGYGIFLTSSVQFNSEYDIFNQGVRNMSLRTAGRYGAALMVGGHYNLQLENLECRYGWHGITNLGMGGSWPTSINRVTCQYYYDAAIYLFLHIGWMNHIYVDYAGTTALRFYNSNVNIKDIMINSQQQRGRGSIINHAGDGQNRWSVEGLSIDNEGDVYPTQGVIIAENNHGGRYHFAAKQIAAEMVGKPGRAAIVYLVDNAEQWPVGEGGVADVIIEDVHFNGDAFSAIVATDGPVFRGVLRGASPTKGPGPILNHGAGGIGNVCSEHYEYKAPPRNGWWYSGLHDLFVRPPADGQYSRFQCIRTGVYGTATRPLWTGLELQRCDDPTSSTYVSTAYVLSEDSVTVNWNLV